MPTQRFQRQPLNTGVNDFLYTPFYCEENIWHLCQNELLIGRARQVVWITGVGECCAVWRQRAASKPGAPIGWDYHVVLLAEDSNGWEIWDLDTVLPCPSLLADYLAGTFPFAGQLAEEWEPRFRVIDCGDFIATFSSDRSHMLDARGRYRKPPPTWPPIGADRISNFARWLDADDPIAERPISREEFVARYGVR